MLANFLIFIFLWLFSSFFFFVSFSSSIFFIVFIFLLVVVDGYSSFLGGLCVSLYGRFSSLGLLMVCLSLWVSAMMFLVRVKYRYNRLFPTLFSFIVGLLLFIIVFFFYTDSLILLYILFEFSLIPTVYLVLKWGYQPERLLAGFYFVIYTICGSLPLLFTVLYLYSCSFSFFLFTCYPFYFCVPSCSPYLFVFSLLFAFLVKVPI